jgi:hypothetical protein
MNRETKWFADSRRYRNAGACPGCGKALVTCRPPTAAKRRQFEGMTGLDLGSRTTVPFNIRRDFVSLDISPFRFPRQATFCIPCACDYMLAFNARHGP